MSDYKIIKVGDDFYIATEDFQRDGWAIRAKIDTVFSNKWVVERDGEFIEPNQKHGDVSFRFGADEDDNWMSISDANPVKVTWKQAQGFIAAYKYKENHDALGARQIQRDTPLQRALNTNAKLL